MRALTVKGIRFDCARVLAGESAPEQYAASELVQYLDKMGVPTEGGEAVLTFELGLDPAIGRDGYAVRAFENRVAIVGGNGRGLIYGVYAFLEKYAGARFFMPGLETLGEGDIAVDEDDSFTPVFEFRQTDWQCGSNDADWRVKNRVNYFARGNTPAEKGGQMKYGGFVHTLGSFTGTPGDQQPCLSDPENLKKTIAAVRNILEKDPEVTIVSVSQNDNVSFCKCERCAAVDAEEGSHAGTLIRFVNEVAADIEKDYPHVVIDTLAYQYSRAVPRMTKPRENVCVRLCSIECCFSHPLDDESCPENKKFHHDIVDWSRICDRIYIWDYVTDFSYYIPTFPNFQVLRQNMRFFAEHGVKGMYPEGNYNSPASGEFGELRCYLLAKLMWNPLMSSTEYYRHMDEFLAAYYGEGWRYIRAYIDFTCSEATGTHMSIWANPFHIIPREKYVAMEDTFDTWWDKAEAMAGDRLEAVRRSRIQWRYIKLMLHPNEEEGKALRADVEAANIRWNEWKNLPDNVDYARSPDQWFD
ncbi:MAG: DUF4838 domain-containing protein [Ruminococcaceae bacterium]|nr:DUF4838 domain-containing protein [Oscillospiraceae bacterium]